MKILQPKYTHAVTLQLATAMMSSVMHLPYMLHLTPYYEYHF